jgi:hypothetical protein
LIIMVDILTNYNIMEAGGFSNTPPEDALSHYSHPWLGPDVADAVVYNGTIDSACRPAQGHRLNLPKGRIFSMTQNGTWKPGVWAADAIPVAAVLVGSDSDDGDVLGGPIYGDPRTTRRAQVPFKLEARAPFWSLAPGYVFYVSEFDPAKTAELQVTCPLTAIPHMTEFDTAGMLTSASVYRDHVVGVVVEAPAPMSGYNPDIMGLKFQGMNLPKLPDDLLV